MKRGMTTAMAIAGIFALSACGNPNGSDDVINEPVPGEEQQMPGDDTLNDDMNDDMNEDMNDDMNDDLNDDMNDDLDDNTNG